jgi:glycosyltransferase involved in cell wall biosynthesis
MRTVSRDEEQPRGGDHGGLKDLRLALIGPLPPPSAGMANQTEQLARLLRAEGVRLVVIPTNPPYRPGWVSRLRGIRAVFRLVSYLLQLRRGLRGARVAHVMANSGWSWYLFAAPAIWSARAAGVPAVVNYRGGGADAFFARSFTWVRSTLARADAVVVPSGFLETVFRKRGIRTEVVPNVIDLGRFSPGEGRDPGRAPHVVIARNLEEIYDIPTGIRAFALVRASLPRARLTVAGTGPLRKPLEDLTAELDLSDAVTFTGRLDNARMATLYRGADLLLNSSRVDNMPISILEAFASGVPVVSTDVGGVPFMVEHGRTGLLVPVGDASAMAQAATRVLGDAALAGAMRGAGLAAVSQYAWPVVRERLARVYTDVVRRRSAVPTSGVMS